MYRPKRIMAYPPRRRFITGRGAYYYKPNPAFLASRNIAGRGSYASDMWNKYKKYVPRAIGAIAGGISGGVPGAISGGMLGAKVSRDVLGWGAYSSPGYTKSAGRPYNGRMIFKGNVPTMHSGNENGFRVSHKECIGVIYSTLGFSCVSYDINPGINSTFPWLSGIARNFQQYDINGLAFVFKPTCSDGNAGVTIANMGSLTMSSDQNVFAELPLSTVQMLQTQFSVSGKPSGELFMPVEQAKTRGGKMTNHLLVRTGGIPAGATRQLYDDCVLFVATDSNGVAGTQLGQLFVTYDITFYNPAVLIPGSEVLTCKVHIENASQADPFGAAAGDFHIEYDNIGVSWGTSHRLDIVRGNAGYFLTDLSYEHAANNTLLDLIVPAGGAAIVTQVYDNASNSYYRAPEVLTNMNHCHEQFVFNITNPLVVTTLTMGAGSTIPAPVASVDLIIIQINPACF